MPTVTTVGALIGRDIELAALVRLVNEVAGGNGATVLIEGELGIGKSMLVRTALADAASKACRTFWGAGDELGQALPLLPLLEALEVRGPSVYSPRQNTIVRLLRGEVAAERGTDVSAAVAEQLLALIAEQSEVQPTILVVDDLQWTDQATVALLGRLIRSMRQLPLLLIGMMRPVPQREDLMALRRALGDDARIQLTGLPDSAVAELVAALAGGDPDDKLLKLADGAAGNPLWVTELIAALARSSGLEITESGRAELTSYRAPRSLSAAIADRLGFVGGAAREVLRAAALLGVDFAVRDLAIVLQRTVADLLPAVDESLAAGVLAETGKALGFRHPMIRAALYDELPKALRAAWHRDAGRALAEAGAPADRVARQLLAALGLPDGVTRGDFTEPLDDWVLLWLTRTAGLLVGQAPQVAVDLLRQALASCPVASEQHDKLVGHLAEVLYRVGDAAAAEQVANRALADAVDPDFLADLHCTLAQCRMRLGRPAESVATLNRALETPGISRGHRARLLALTARTHGSLGEVEKAGQVATAALTAASETGDTWAMGWALHVLTIVTAVQGQLIDALPLFDRALTVTRADPALTDLRLLVQINHAVALGSLDRPREAIAAARQARHLADQVGTLVRLAQAHSALGQLLFDTGRWEEALAEVETLQEDLKEPAAACCDFGVAAAICFHRGEVVAARRNLDAAVPHAERLGSRIIAPLALARSLDCERAGALPEALAVLTVGFIGNSEELEEIEELLPDAVRLACETGDLDTADALAGHAASLAVDAEIPHRQANALHCRGLLDSDGAQLLRAAARYDDASRPLLRAKAFEAAARCFVEADDRVEARAAFTQAVEIYATLGAAADVARIQARFRAHGIRRGPRAKHRQVRSGWESLTPTEMKVADLVQSGLSNPEIATRLFLSKRTVATHVSHILKKLNVHSRTDIAREAALRAAGHQ